ncbi:hypothetical protein, partial [Metabacillus idriensis]|uniref:hypothetical protein n=1 Tax=Metabacillus idriensis TaxID=324768 RepID=UPI003D27C55C
KAGDIGVPRFFKVSEFICFSMVSSSIAQLLGQNGPVCKGKKRLFSRFLICLSELNGRFRFS